ncbi:MAG TPA: hypothetical protein VIS56_02045 [Candidatus Saccharimonadales bacterium]
MFGGQDGNNPTPQVGGSASQDDTLSGVTDLIGGTATPAPEPPASSPSMSSDFMPAPSEPPQSSVPSPSEEAEGVVSAPQSSTSNVTAMPSDGDDLLDLKQQALQQLTPLVGHLDQSPEEKFRTTMMLIQASDNQALLKDAYDAAQTITDEKTKAQALLDVINEINYFTQNKQ